MLSFYTRAHVSMLTERTTCQTGSARRLYNHGVRLLPSLRTLLGVAVVIYLCAAGWFFILAPWSRFWTTLVIPEAPLWLLPVVDSPAARGALSGFGLLHFAVAAGWLSVGGDGT